MIDYPKYNDVKNVKPSNDESIINAIGSTLLLVASVALILSIGWLLGNPG